MKISVLGSGYIGRSFKGFVDNVFSYRKWINNGSPYHIFEDSDVIINCAAFSPSRECEDPKNWALVKRDNIDLPIDLSRYCSSNNKKFVHLSTGCLYDNGVLNGTEDSQSILAAHMRYTLSKWSAECGINSDAIILRPRLCFSGYFHDRNLLCRLSSFPVLNIALNSVTYVPDIVFGSMALIENNKSGVFNICCDTPISPYEIAKEYLHLKPIPVKPKKIRKNVGVFLVDNTMSNQKIKDFYTPTSLEVALTKSVSELEL